MTQRKPTLNALLEALAHTRQQSPLLSRIYYPLPNAKHDYYLDNGFLHYPVSDGKQNWTLVVPLEGSFGVTAEKIRQRIDECSPNAYFAESRYIHSALTLFDSEGNIHKYPAIVEQAVTPLGLFVRRNCSARHRSHIRFALESVALGAESLLNEEIKHGSLTRRNICFNDHDRLSLTDYAWHIGSSDDLVDLAEAALLLYIAGSEMGAFKALESHSQSIQEHEHRLRCILATAQHYSLRSIVKLVEQIEQGASAESLVEAIKGVAAEPFRSLPLLKGLLGTTNHSDQSSYKAMSNPCEDVTRVDFEQCDEVLYDKGEIVRYRRNGLWGYARRDGTRLRLQRILRYAEEFADGLAVVKTERGYGAMDTTGRMLFNDVFESLCWHSEERIVTACDDRGKWHIYDPQGRQLSSEASEWMGSVAEGMVVARKGKRFGYYSTNGRLLTGFVYEEAFGFLNGLALVKRAGKRHHIDINFKPLSSYDEDFIQRVRGYKE